MQPAMLRVASFSAQKKTQYERQMIQNSKSFNVHVAVGSYFRMMLPSQQTTISTDSQTLNS
jgi:hypothetical protein